MSGSVSGAARFAGVGVLRLLQTAWVAIAGVVLFIGTYVAQSLARDVWGEDGLSALFVVCAAMAVLPGLLALLAFVAVRRDRQSAWYAATLAAGPAFVLALPGFALFLIFLFAAGGP